MATKSPRKESRLPNFDAETFLHSVGFGRRNLKFKTKEALFRQGDAANSIFYIEKGNVQVSVVSDQGKECVIGMLSAGDFVGEGCLAGQVSYLSSANATGPTSAVSIDKIAMLRVLIEQPTLSEVFTAFLLSRNIQFEADLVDQLFNSSEKRLARVLLQLADFGKNGEREVVIPKISQEILAARVGTTRGRINFFMNKFRKMGLIEYDGEITVRSELINIIIND